MQLTFRWYGDKDPISLDKIAQIPCIEGVVSAIYDTPVGSIWGYEAIEKLKEQCYAHKLHFDVVESVPVHEDIKLARGNYRKYIDNYKENIRRLAENGVKCICYNFMPVFDWLRSELKKEHSDGSNSLAYDNQKLLSFNPESSELSLPGWDSSYSKDELKGLLNAYRTVNENQLFDNLATFLQEIIPVARENDVKMAIHPDDPPWGIFGLPRIIKNKDDITKMLSAVDDQYNGITFCTGSLGVSKENSLEDMISAFRGRIHFAHLRNIKITGERCFEETAHISSCGDIDMLKIIRALHFNGFKGYVRPDHGRMIWGESGRVGYGLFDRALGAMYLSGLIEAVKKIEPKESL